MLCASPPAAGQTDRDQCAEVGNRAAADQNIAACTRILDDRSEPNLAAALGNRCGLWITKGDLDRAIADCDEAIRRDPNIGDAYAKRGIAWSRIGADDRAIADYDRALQLDPKNADVYLNRGNSHAARRDFDRAIADFDAAIGLNPDLAMAYNNRGVVQRNKGDVAGAVADYGEAIRLAPNLAMAYRNRGRAQRNKDELDAAITDFDTAIRLDPNDAGSFGSRCWARAVAGRDLAQALADCDESLRLRPGDGDTLNSRGLVQLKRGALDRAVADYAAAVAQDGKDADSRFGRGIARLRLGDRAGGEGDIAAAAAMRPGIAEDYVGYGVTMVAAGGQPAQVSGDAAARDYQLAAQIGTRAGWEAFLKQYPSGFHADLARAQLEKLGVVALEATGTIDRDKAERDKAEKEGLARALADRARVAAPVLTAELAPPSPQPSPPLSGGALVEEIKKGLAQLGCYAGPIDDKWKTASTRSAVKKFVAAVHPATATEKPTQGLLDAVRSSAGRVCPSACGPRELKRKGECVAKTCPGKLVLDDVGKCVKPDDKTKRAALPDAAVPVPRAAPSGLAKKK
jgi:tetratricopeptide (TPR) repeat protein